MNLPNALTVIRIVLVPLLVAVLLTKFEGRAVLGIHVEFVAAAIFGLAVAHRLARRLSGAAPRSRSPGWARCSTRSPTSC